MKRKLFGGASLAVMTALWAVGCGSDAFTAAPPASDGGAGAGGTSSAGAAGLAAGGSSAGQPGGGAAHGGSSAAGSGSVVGEAGEGGVSAAAGAGGVTPTGGVSGVGGSSGAAGAASGGSPESGGSSASGGSSNAGGAAGELGEAGGCANPVTWFPDGDGDGFGRSSGQVVGCDPPATGVWVAVGGDCDDDNVHVFPKNKDFFGDAYVPTSGGSSYDYDCENGEQSDPSQYGAASPCNNVLACSGVGFVPTGRTASGQNALCGSTSLSTCVKSGLSCTSVVTPVSAHRCH